jgi:hypothetical protein
MMDLVSDDVRSDTTTHDRFFFGDTYRDMMMATTHALAGVALALGVSVVVPEAGGIPVAAAALGGLFPDFDLTGDHRRTLHFPVYYSLAALIAAVLAVALPTIATLAAALFLAAAALHSVMDAAGGGLEPRPWLARSDRGVYDHARGRWIAPRRWIRYDGAPEDLLLCVALAVPALVALDGVGRLAVVGALVVSTVYTLLRKPLVALADRVVPKVPQHVLDRFPDRLTSLVAAYR